MKRVKGYRKSINNSYIRNIIWISQQDSEKKVLKFFDLCGK